MLLVRRRLLRQLGPLSLGMAIANVGAAAEWTSSAGIAPGFVFTDNVCLSSTNEQSEWIAEVTPDIAIRGDGSRASFDLAASVNVNSLTDSKLEDLGCNVAGFGSNRKQFAPRLRAKGDAVLVEDWLYVDANARVEQNEASPFFKGGGDPLNTTGNTNTLYDYTLSPYIKRRFKDVALFNLRYSWDDQYNTEDIVGDSAQERWTSTLGSVSGTSPAFWQIQGDYSKVDYDEQRDFQSNSSELKSVQLNLGYQVSRKWQVNGYYGEEWNDFFSRYNNIDGTYWDAGLRWEPNSRTTINAGTGHRFYGDSPRFSISHAHKRSTFNASYEKILTYDRNIRAGDEGSFSEAGDDLPPGINQDSSTLSNSPILNESFGLGYVYRGNRSRLNVNGNYSDQTRESDGGDSTFKRVAVFVNRELSRQLTISSQLSWNEQEPKSASNITGFINATETWRFYLEGKRTLNNDVSLSLNYQYTDQQADNEFNQYKENRFTITLRFKL